MRNRIKRISLLLLVLVVIVIIPFVTEWLVGRRGEGGVFSQSDWASFYGGYVGSIIGALVTLVGVYITIYYSEQQRIKDRKAECSPYLNYRFVQCEREPAVDQSRRLDSIYCNDSGKGHGTVYGILTLSNVGIGPAIDCHVTDIYYNHKLVKRTSTNVISNAIATNDSMDIYIMMSSYVGYVQEQERDPDANKYVLKEHINRGGSEVSFCIAYHDIYETQYRQMIVIRLSTVAGCAQGDPWKYISVMEMSHIGSREEV